MRSHFVVTALVLAALGLLGLTPLASADENQTKARRASIRIRMPADAKLTINGKAPKNRGSRWFITPQLQKGQKFTCHLKAEFTRGKNTVTVARKITLRAGQNKVVSLRLPGLSSRRRDAYGATRRTATRRGVTTYRFSVSPPSDSAYGTYSYRDMRADEDSVRD
jgi:uncharacterized protein (TIGR03000 family)